MRAFLVPTVPLMLAIVGCADRASSVMAPDVGSAVGVRAAAAPAVPRHIEGHCELAFNPPPFPLPAVHRQVDRGTCWFSHLGRTELYGEQEINFAAGTQSGFRTFTAANGDVMRAVHAGRSAPIAPGIVGFTTTITIVGGTGRFANATGQMTGEGTANLATRTTTVTNEGWIEYDASDRSDQ